MTSEVTFAVSRECKLRQFRVDIATWLIARGFPERDEGGNRIRGLAPMSHITIHGTFGLVQRRPDDPPRSYCFGLIALPPKPWLVGHVTVNQEVVIEVYGERNIAPLKNLGEELARAFSVRVHVKLMSIQERRQAPPR